MTGEFTLEVLGEPRGKGRPRFSRKTGRAYTDDQTSSAEGLVQHAWDQAGRPRLTGPLAMSVTAIMSRPQGHYLTGGDLNKQGRMAPWSCKVPDVDNFIKLAQDALNRLAFHDDSHIVTVNGTKRWAAADELPRMVIQVWCLNTVHPMGQAA